jgi:hypothetical protein
MSNNLIIKFFCYRILSYRILERNGNQETFRQFLHQIHDDADADGLAGATLVMNNVGFHKTELVREELIILISPSSICQRILHFSIQLKICFQNGKIS